MRKQNEVHTDIKLSVTASTLAGMLDCGEFTARKLGDKAGARIKVGKRVLYSVDKIAEYLVAVAE